ncbi:MAG TPA: hypothetical protein VNA17_09625 [Pyrinomonadaceae bacterium]|nr:hypothetical protein [Pyrinomonadaceae bacterium]
MCLLSMGVPAVFGQTTEPTQGPVGALQRGYRTGYSDGYMAGYRDTIDSVAKSYIRHAEYSKADRAFSKDYGDKEEYRDGYQQGFEAGYDTGYGRRSFEAALPTSLNKRGVREPRNQTREPALIAQSDDSASSSISVERKSEANDIVNPISNNPAYQSPTYLIPRDTEIIVELQDSLNTEQSREGEKFTARVVSPSELAGATLEGRVSKILKPGRIKRRSELSLSFDRIILSDNRWSNFNASLIEVMAIKGDNVKRVDNEGTALGQSSLKGDIIKVGGSTGAGALIGGVVGGPVGVAVGAGVGAAFGVGAVVIERGKHIRLNENQQLRIKSSYETQIR